MDVAGRGPTATNQSRREERTMGYHLQSRKAGGFRRAKTGRGLPGHSSQKATVGVLAGRNPALPGAAPSAAPGVLRIFPPRKKKKKKKRRKRG